MARQCFSDVDRRRPRPNPFEHPRQAPLARSWRAGTERISRPSNRPMSSNRVPVEADTRHQADPRRFGGGRRGEARAPAAKACGWVLGRDAQKDDCGSRPWGSRASAPPAIAKRMLIEFGVYLTEKAVNSRMTRLQIARDRFDIIEAFDEEAVQRRAAEAKRRVGSDAASVRRASTIVLVAARAGRQPHHLPGIREKQALRAPPGRTLVRRHHSDGGLSELELVRRSTRVEL